ncbi:MAG: ABC transporter permease [Pirellulaceae bacterium]
MIGTVIKVSVLRTWNSKQELLLIFAVPVLFFSIFALIFSRGVGMTVKTVRVTVINDVGTEHSRQVVKNFLEREEIESVGGVGKTSENWPIARLARSLISQLDTEVVVYFPETAKRNDAATSTEPRTPTVRLLNEGTNPISAQVVEAALAQAIAASHPSLPITTAQFTSTAPASAVQLASATLPVGSSFASSLGTKPLPSFEFEQENVFASNKHQPKVAMYAAGIAVMFILFASSGAAASLLEEKEAGTLGRLLSSRMSVTELMIGKWLSILGLGMLQMTTMFAWGQLVFEVDLLGHLPGFIVMSTVTCAASASFALFLATLCKSRTQLNGVSLVLVLGMSAIGGSMIPRYIMSDTMKQLGHLTFNGWALDGFKKIFWYDLPLSAIRTEVAVLGSMALILGLFAIWIGQRLKTA